METYKEQIAKNITRETHKRNKIEWNEELKHGIEQTREEILEKFSIPSCNVFIEEFEEGEQRPARLFLVLLHKDNPQKSVYAEGSSTHGDLHGLICEKLKEEKLSSRQNLAREIMDLDSPFFKMKRGFIDPYGNNFESFKMLKSRRQKVSEYEGGKNWIIPS